METTKSFSINAVGETTGRIYSGKFTVKTVLTRGERFEADRKRRELLGPNGFEALADLQMEAFYLGRLAVQIADGPKWWLESNGGVGIEDANIVLELWKLTQAKESEAKEELQKEAEAALKKIASSAT